MKDTLLTAYLCLSLMIGAEFWSLTVRVVLIKP
uniref:Uncharacterized protein n=1 Tax=Rhizophora mucronata TaxID=61149 RepID=A0A2P2R031_RHIMU